VEKLQWWCAALGEKWTWNWRAYPGVWLFVIAVAASRRLLTGAGSWRLAPAGEKVAFVAGVFTLWLSLDWPIGPVAAGYLASAHALQFLIITMISTPLLLIGARTGTVERLIASTAHPLLRRVGRFVVHPLSAVLIFNAIVSASHVPSVVDGLMPSAAGAFLVDLSWFVGGIVFWWPVIIPYPRLTHFAVPMKILYLLGGTLFHTVIGMIMLVSEHPMYGIYELAQPIFAIAPRTDQQVAGGVMELGVFFAIVIASGVLFFRWAGESERGHPSTVNSNRSTST
jgi:cytochrome c oxidase assembly factor CtaG